MSSEQVIISKGRPVYLTTVVSNSNSTFAALGSNQTFTGGYEDVTGFTSAVLSVATDQNATLFIDQSADGINTDSSLQFNISASLNEVHRVVITRKFIRARIVNGSSVQSYLRAQCIYGDHSVLSSPLNQSSSQDADAIIVKTIDEELALSANLFDGISVIQKFGRNPDIDTASVPEDIWNGGGAYTGFPTGSPEEFEVFSSDAGDTGVLTVTYLASSTSTEYSTFNVTLNGTTPVNTGVTGFRVHTARYKNGAASSFNLGTITLRHRVTTANVFFVMPIGRSQTYMSGYRIPSGHTGYIKRIFCRVNGATTGVVEGGLWVRTNGSSPRLRRPFTAAQQDSFEEYPYGGIQISENSDLIVRIVSASANNLDVVAGYDIVLVRNQ